VPFGLVRYLRELASPIASVNRKEIISRGATLRAAIAQRTLAAFDGEVATRSPRRSDSRARESGKASSSEFNVKLVAITRV